jgi:site-specific recombinase XerD
VANKGNVRRGEGAVVEAAGRFRGVAAIEAGYQHFRLERQGALLAPNTLLWYDRMVLPFLAWLGSQDVRRFEDLDAGIVRSYLAGLASRPGGHGRPLAPKTLLESHRAILCFLRWARREGYEIDPRIMDLVPPRVPQKEPTIYHIAQLHKILEACSAAVPTEELVVRLLVGSGLRQAEVCGLAAVGPDGLPDVMTDSLHRGRVELRVRWNAGAKGSKSRRVPITPKLATAIKRYEARHRRDTGHPHLLISEHGGPSENSGIRSMMDRLQKRTGFHVHAHGFRHTFATVATKLGWTFEHLRAAMGHSEYGLLQRYVRLATERDLGSRKDWLDFIVANPSLDWA